MASTTNAYYRNLTKYETWNDEVRSKTAKLHTDQIENYLKERCILNQIIVPEQITVKDCEIGETHDTFTKRVWFQPETRAYLSTFEATPQDVQEVFVPRANIGFLMLSTPSYTVNDYNLEVYPFNVVEQIEDQIGIDMQEAREWVMLDALERAIQLARSRYGNVIRGEEAQADIDAGNFNSGFRGELNRMDLISLKQYFARSRSRCNALVVPETDYIDLERFDITEYGDDLMTKVFTSGLEQDTVHGLKILRTIKIDNRLGDTFREGNIYAFAREEELGKNYNLRGIRFFVNRDHQHLYFDAQESFGFVWQVIARVAKLELYNGGTKEGSTDLVDPFDASNQIPGSDELWSSPEEFMEKDYYDLDKEFRVPDVHVTGS